MTIVFDDYLGKWNYKAIPNVKAWSYSLAIPKYLKIDQLSKAQTLYKAQLDPELEEELKEKYPNLFKEAYIIGFRSVY